jgi:hypothetical protein
MIDNTDQHSRNSTTQRGAIQLGHSRVSMTQDVYLGRRVANAGNLAALESYGPPPTDAETEGR